MDYLISHQHCTFYYTPLVFQNGSHIAPNYKSHTYKLKSCNIYEPIRIIATNVRLTISISNFKVYVKPFLFLFF